jgi:hypothetical protein
MVNSRIRQPGQPGYKSTTVDDIKKALFHNKKANSVPLLLVSKCLLIRRRRADSKLEGRRLCRLPVQPVGKTPLGFPESSTRVRGGGGGDLLQG